MKIKSTIKSFSFYFCLFCVQCDVKPISILALRRIKDAIDRVNYKRFRSVGCQCMETKNRLSPFTITEAV